MELLLIGWGKSAETGPNLDRCRKIRCEWEGSVPDLARSESLYDTPRIVNLLPLCAEKRPPRARKHENTTGTGRGDSRFLNTLRLWNSPMLATANTRRSSSRPANSFREPGEGRRSAGPSERRSPASEWGHFASKRRLLIGARANRRAHHFPPHPSRGSASSVIYRPNPGRGIARRVKRKPSEDGIYSSAQGILFFAGNRFRRD